MACPRRPCPHHRRNEGCVHRAAKKWANASLVAGLTRKRVFGEHGVKNLASVSLEEQAVGIFVLVVIALNGSKNAIPNRWAGEDVFLQFGHHDSRRDEGTVEVPRSVINLGSRGEVAAALDQDSVTFLGLLWDLIDRLSESSLSVGPAAPIDSIPGTDERV